MLSTGDHKHSSPSTHLSITTALQSNALPDFKTRAYQVFQKEFSIDISTQSKLNMQRLENFFKNAPLNEQENKLKTLWEEKLVPLITLKHGVTKITFDALTPIAMREEKGNTVNNPHTFGYSLRYFAYFVLGIGSNHPLPNFIASDSEIIEVKLGQLDENQQKDLGGLWVSGDLDQYISSKKLDPVMLGTTIRHINFCNDTKTKVYCYERADGSWAKRTVPYQDELFSVDEGLKTLFDALFYQFIIELRYIDGDFKKFIYNNSDNPEIITHAFHTLFPSYIYPEVKLPKQILLKNPYVKLHRTTQDINIKNLYARWFKATESGNMEILKQCLIEAERLSINLINAKNDNAQTALRIAVTRGDTKDKCYTDVIGLLLEQGADITLITGIFTSDTALHDAIRFHRLNAVKLLLGGTTYPRIPMAKKYVNLNDNQWIIFAIHEGDSEIVSYILERIWRISNDSTVIIAAYQSRYKHKKDLIIQLQGKGANIDAVDKKDKTALMHATADGNQEYVQFLIEQGAEWNRENNSGTTPYSVVLSRLEECDLATYKNEHRDEIKRNEMLLSRFSSPAERKKEDTEKNIEAAWKTFRKNLDEVKTYLETKGANLQQTLKTESQKCTYTKFCCAAIITGKISDQSVVVLGRKKNDYTTQPMGYYLFPGGYKDNTDKTHAAAIKREILEETGINIDPAKIKEFYRYKKIDKVPDGNINVEIVFFHIDLGTELADCKLIADDDMTALELVKWSEVKREHYADGAKESYYYKNTRINQANALLIETVFSHKDINTQSAQINAALAMELPSTILAVEVAIKSDYQQAIIDAFHQGFDFNKIPALIYACTQKDSEKMVDLLITFHVEVNSVYKTTTPLGHSLEVPVIMATQCGHNDLVKHLVEKCNANINLAPGGNSALVAACKTNNEFLVNYFLSNKEIKLDQEVGGKALLETIGRKNRQLLERLLALKKIDLNVQYHFLGNTHYPLSFALGQGTYDLVPPLLNAGADVYIMESTTRTLFNYLLSQLKFFLSQIEMLKFYEKPKENPAFLSTFRYSNDAFDEHIKFIKENLLRGQNIDTLTNVAQLIVDEANKSDKKSDPRYAQYAKDLGKLDKKIKKLANRTKVESNEQTHVSAPIYSGRLTK